MTHPPCLRLCPAYPGNPRYRIEGESPLQGKGHTVYGASPFAGLFDIVKCECGQPHEDVAVMNRREGGRGMDSACQPLDRLRTLVLANVPLQQKLRATDDADQFVAL